MVNDVLVWLQVNWIETLATIIGIIYLVFSVKQNILLWIFGLMTSLLYIYVYFNSQFYADMALQIYYVVISIYGWFHWSKGGENESTLKVSTASTTLMVKCVALTLVLWLGIYFLLSLTNSDVPVGDAFTTAAAIVATWMLAQKLIENWLFWIVIDSVSLILYIHKELWPTVVLFGAYTLVAIIGYFKWRTDMYETQKLA
ncbi:MAG: nicotinamide riboside transporter PnuC [Salinivirgaceae bacterium]|nr:nicotinamide riboside transporter PnuC [Salinivirgaceae bacterium]MDD4746907.1 nicotinamide riboside transporter PnuC [Salinivirgaceae bacterium]MDY0282128.1 nicotinamide riboside transporter PnuC [Salinivirgaceae bacterium]